MTIKKSTPRPDRSGKHRAQFDRARKRIYSTQKTCGICGGEVDFSLKFPNPMSACVDHIIPVSKGGHPSDINNLQLAHFICNRVKSDKLMINELGNKKTDTKEVKNNILPWTLDWLKYKSKS